MAPLKEGVAIQRKPVVESKNVSLVLPDVPVFQKILKMQIFIKCEISRILNLGSI